MPELSVADMSPGYFAFPMATGILALAADDHGLKSLAVGLLWFNVAVYVVLTALTIFRIARWRRRVVEDLTHHSRGAAFLTQAAATCILGCEFALAPRALPVAIGLWAAGVVLWILLSYSFLAVIIVLEPKPSIESGINGAWLLLVVATESVSVLGSLVAPALSGSRAVLFLALSAFLAGAMLYIFFISLILYRWTFFRMRPERLSPDYWIDMGALAITTLAGAQIFRVSGEWSVLHGLAPFLQGFTFLFWATATWWIPLLLIIELWRHTLGKVPYAYSPDYWSLVFPLGTYSAATFLLAGTTGLPALKWISTVAFAAALAAWLVVLVGLAHAGLRAARRPAA